MQEQEINLQNTSGIMCKCGCPLFDISYVVRKQSRLLTGAPSDIIVPVQVITCKDCGSICAEALAPPVRAMFQKDAIERDQEDAPDEPPSNIIQMGR